MTHRFFAERQKAPRWRKAEGRRLSLFRVVFCLLPFAWIATVLESSQQPTFRAGVTLVSTDVIPRDDKGRFVGDLTVNDFSVFEDGLPQTVTSFTVVRGGRTFNLLQPPAAAAVPEGIILPSGGEFVRVRHRAY